MRRFFILVNPRKLKTSKTSKTSSRLKYFENKNARFFSSLRGNEQPRGEEFYSFGFRKVTEQIKTKLINNLFSDVSNKYDLMNDLMSLRLHRCWKEEFVKELDVFLKYYTFNALEMLNTKNIFEDKSLTNNLQKKEIFNNVLNGGMEKKKKEEKEKVVEYKEQEDEEEDEDEDKEEERKTKEFVCKCKILDLAGGTGDIAFKIIERIQFYISKYDEYIFDKKILENCYPDIIVCDPNENMLNEGKKKAEKLNFHNITWLNEYSENLKSIEDNSIDIVTVSFGIRNFTNLSNSLNEIYRVLKPGGRFLCLEFMNLKDYKHLNILYKLYLNNVIPLLGAIVANNKDAYKYLSESIQVFLTPEELSKLIYNANFRNVHYTTLTCGIVAIHSAYKVH